MAMAMYLVEFLNVMNWLRVVIVKVAFFWSRLAYASIYS
jgi:hypothetical protein